MENYTGVIYLFITAYKPSLAPTCGEGKTDTDKAKANDHVPGTDAWDWVARGGDVENHNPEEANQEGADHCGCEPTRALHLHWLALKGSLNDLMLFNLLAYLRFWHVERVLPSGQLANCPR